MAGAVVVMVDQPEGVEVGLEIGPEQFVDRGAQVEISASGRSISDQAVSTSSARVKSEGYAAADKLVNDAKDPISKAAARIAADKLKKEADKKEQQFVAEADKRADGLVASAKAKGDQLIQQAENTDTEIK